MGRRFNPIEELVHLHWNAATNTVVVWDQTGNATPESKIARLDYIREHGKLAIIESTPGTYDEDARKWLNERVPEHEYCSLGAYYFFQDKHKNVAFEFRMLFG